MANVQKENGFTAIANEVLDNLIKYEFPRNTSGCPISLCLCVIRKTWGYQKKMDRISLTHFQKATNFPRPTIVHWLDYLVKANLLVVDKKLKAGSVYGFNKDHEQWLPLVKAIELVKARKFTGSVALTKTGSVALTHKRKKETIQKKTAEQGSAVSPFIFKDYLETMVTHQQSHIRLIASYFHFKGSSFDSLAETQVAIKRHLRDAVQVSKFGKIKIIRAMEECVKEEKERPIGWTLGTVLKKLTK